MRRVWLVSFVCLHAVVWVAPHTLYAQYDNRPRSVPNSGLNQRAAFVVDESVPEPETPKKITPAKQAATTSNRAADGSSKPASPTASLWTSFGALAILVVAILLFARAWKKHGPRLGGSIPPEAVEVLGKRHLDPRQTLHLVRLGSRILLLGSSPAGLRTLAEVTDPVDVDFLAGVCKHNDADGTAAQTFRALFNRNLPERPAQRRRKRTASSDERRENDDSQEILQHDLEETRG